MAQNTGTITFANKSKYGAPPTWEQIYAFIKETGMSMYHFERFYGIPYNTLTQVKSGKRNLFSAYWHIIYEKIKPAYGVGFIGDFTTEIINGEPVKKDIMAMEYS